MVGIAEYFILGLFSGIVSAAEGACPLVKWWATSRLTLKFI
jgi:hypothetical protein